MLLCNLDSCSLLHCHSLMGSAFPSIVAHKLDVAEQERVVLSLKKSVSLHGADFTAQLSPTPLSLIISDALTLCFHEIPWWCARVRVCVRGLLLPVIRYWQTSVLGAVGALKCEQSLWQRMLDDVSGRCLSHIPPTYHFAASSLEIN